MAGCELLPAVRLRDWQSRLSALILERAEQHFEWGRNDCASFAADCVQAVTGVDRMKDLRAGYINERQAMRLIDVGGGLTTMLTDRLGPAVRASLARPGDVGVTVQGQRLALCVFGGTAWHMPGEHGLVSLDSEQVISAWRCEGH